MAPSSVVKLIRGDEVVRVRIVSLSDFEEICYNVTRTFGCEVLRSSSIWYSAKQGCFQRLTGDSVAEFASLQKAGPGADGISRPLRLYVLEDSFSGELQKLASSQTEGESQSLESLLSETAELQKVLAASAADARERLSHVLNVYEAKLRPVMADGNCQFRALSAQLFDFSEAQHEKVRELVVGQLRAKPTWYEGYVQGCYDEYVERLAKNGEWGDHVTLQAASDVLGCEIHVLTDLPGSACVELQPREPRPAKSGVAPARPLCLTFLTEVHYDSAEFQTD
ncbi:unnamed protein product [Polarella glacialis]|uniref:OTU domain-containing protein n=1 Tax=Polarella glacialis TaxID=89957 RepID=A0A813HRX2_POLGL|nr:unnamed protein product [Polarella glacialis]